MSDDTKSKQPVVVNISPPGHTAAKKEGEQK